MSDYLRFSIADRLSDAAVGADDGVLLEDRSHRLFTSEVGAVDPLSLITEACSHGGVELAVAIEVELLICVACGVAVAAGCFARGEDDQPCALLRELPEKAIEMIPVGKNAIDDRRETARREVVRQCPEVAVAELNLSFCFIGGATEWPDRAGDDHRVEIIGSDAHGTRERRGNETAHRRLAGTRHPGHDPGHLVG